MNAVKCRKSSSRLLATVCVMSLALSFFVISVAPAGMIVRNGTVDDIGKGFGNILVVLSLHDSGSKADGLQDGSISWNGTKDVATGDDVTNQSQTQTVAAMLAKGINSTNLAIVLNLNNNAPLHTRDFVLKGFDAAGNELFTSRYEVKDDPDFDGKGVKLDPATGQGSAGNLFLVKGTDSGSTSLADFFKNPTNRVGMEVPVGQGQYDSPEGGSDDFYVAAGIAPVPEPASMTLLGIGVAGIMGYGWRRRRQVAAEKSAPSVA